MLTAEEGEGWQQFGENLSPHGPDHHYLFQEIFDGRADIVMGQQSNGSPSALSKLLGEGDASSILKSPDGTDFQLFDGSALNSPGGEVSSTLLGKADVPSAGGLLDSLRDSMVNMAGGGMPIGFLSQLFQLLLSFISTGINEIGNQIQQAAAAAASEASKKLKI